MLIINKHYSTIIVINVPNRVETVSAQYSRGNIISFGVQFMNSTEEKYNIDRLEFAIFCIENIAIRLNKDARAVYSALADTLFRSLKSCIHRARTILLMTLLML